MLPTTKNSSVGDRPSGKGRDHPSPTAGIMPVILPFADHFHRCPHVYPLMRQVNMEKKALILGISEGVIVFALAVLFHYGIGMGSQIFRERHKNRVEEEGVETMVGMDPQGRIHAFAEAVDELSVAFAAMDGRQKPKQQDHLDILAQEITGKLCADCDGCVVCLEQQKPDFWIKIRRMLQAVAQHSTKEEILSQNFMEECPRYSGMVEEAIWAFSRMELNEAWYHRLQENRKVIADQLDTMADALQDWDQGIRCMDRTERVLLAKIAFETRERGLDVKQIHVYEDKEKRRMVTALVASKWGGGIPVKNYRKALERASGMAVRLKEDTRSILTQEPVMITAYEDTCFYALSGVASEKRRGIECQCHDLVSGSFQPDRPCLKHARALFDNF